MNWKQHVKCCKRAEFIKTLQNTNARGRAVCKDQGGEDMKS